MLISVHIPKTAGTAFRTILRRISANACISTTPSVRSRPDFAGGG